MVEKLCMRATEIILVKLVLTVNDLFAFEGSVAVHHPVPSLGVTVSPV